MRWHDTTCTYFRGVSCLLGEEQWLHKAFDTQQLKIVTKRPSWFLVCNVMVEEQYQVPVQCRVYEFCEILLFSLGPCDWTWTWTWDLDYRFASLFNHATVGYCLPLTQDLKFWTIFFKFYGNGKTTYCRGTKCVAVGKYEYLPTNSSRVVYVQGQKKNNGGLQTIQFQIAHAECRVQKGSLDLLSLVCMTMLLENWKLEKEEWWSHTTAK
jgi:hypothetical protein